MTVRLNSSDYSGVVPINISTVSTFSGTTKSNINLPITIKHDEDKLEELFWEFDSQSQYRGERLVFKEMLRGYAAHLAKQ